MALKSLFLVSTAVDSLIHPKNSAGNQLRSRLRAILALDHSRLGVENKFLENKSGRIFAFDKFTLQNLANKSGRVQTNLLYFLCITSEVKEYYEALFLSYRPQTMAVSFTIFQSKLHSLNIQDHRSTCWLLVKFTRLMCDVRRLISDVRHLLSDIWFLLLCMVSDVWFLICVVMSDIRRLISNVVCYQTSDFWCQTSVIRRKHKLQHKPYWLGLSPETID